MILRQTQADTGSVPIGRTVARERCRLNVDRICCLVHFRHENNCRIWIFITWGPFILRLYGGNISGRRKRCFCSAHFDRKKNFVCLGFFFPPWAFSASMPGSPYIMDNFLLFFLLIFVHHHYLNEPASCDTQFTLGLNLSAEKMKWWW